jgi:hypothetical protein
MEPVGKAAKVKPSEAEKPATTKAGAKASGSTKAVTGAAAPKRAAQRASRRSSPASAVSEPRTMGERVAGDAEIEPLSEESFSIGEDDLS